MNASSQEPLFSDRELDVIQFLQSGLEPRDIAEKLGITDAQVDSIIQKIFQKLNVQNRVEFNRKVTIYLLERTIRGHDFNIDELSLTEREKDVLAQINSGKSNSEIARNLFLSESTIKVYIRNILEVLNISTHAQAFSLAERVKLFYENLAGDSTTAAPPPDVNKKKKRKGS